ncbi:phospholipase effector Tle1 domain-containing protein [Lysobacter soli]|uniref:phospholipase effector Tle1 domain-containing protein n=1 Tax=Lysobacter soli TaxID=453783 RepID=UPI00241077E9|nr:DUF2235 domain-containing protein [Lysobacter soli]MDG2519231.1 DUF2235 domain-containing protein [Lysobacter soli]
MSLFKLHPAGPTPGVPYLSPRTICRADQCEEHVNIGLFFDGSGNNMYVHMPLKKDSNVARLFRAYKDDRPAGYYRHYMPGVGTRFPEIGENDEAGRTGGMGMGLGGDGRILYGMLMVLDSLHRRVRNNVPLLSGSEITALCRNGNSLEGKNPFTQKTTHRASHEQDTPILAKLGLDGGLLAPAIRRRYLPRLVSRVRGAIEGAARPKILEIFIDVFGFSRGAAEARVFLHWMGELFDGETLCGVPVRFRFAGLFDTVASVIWPNSANGSGHLAWARTEHLRIPARVHACVHYVAMHEPRASFPVDWVMQGRTTPTNCHEYLLAGALRMLEVRIFLQSRERAYSGATTKNCRRSRSTSCMTRPVLLA